MRIAGPEALGALLVSRMSADGRAGGSVTVGELLRTFLPYHSVRSELGLTMKVEYDLALLRFLGSDEHVSVDSDLSDAIRRELSAPEPGIDFLSELGDAEVAVKPEAWAAWSGGFWPPEAPAASGGLREDPDEASESATGTLQRCRRCARALPEDRDTRFCPICGADQTEPACPDCEERLERGWAYCPRCGRTIEK